jgi:hypothetical protein
MDENDIHLGDPFVVVFQMTEQIRLCLAARRGGIRSATALRIRKSHRPFGKFKFFYPNGRW